MNNKYLVFFMILACCNTFFSGEVDQYFNSGNIIKDTTQPAGSHFSGSAVDLYDNLVTFYYDSGTRQVTIAKYTEKGELVSSFGTSGKFQFSYSGADSEDDIAMRLDPVSGDIYILKQSSDNTVRVDMVSGATGALDLSFTPFTVSAPGAMTTVTTYFQVSPSRKLHIILTGEDSGNVIQAPRYWRYGHDGTADYSDLAVDISGCRIDLSSFIDFAVDEDDYIYMGGDTDNGKHELLKFEVETVLLTSTLKRLSDSGANFFSDSLYYLQSGGKHKVFCYNGYLMWLVIYEEKVVIRRLTDSLSLENFTDSQFSSSAIDCTEHYFVSLTIRMEDANISRSGELFVAGRYYDTIISKFKHAMFKINSSGELDRTFGAGNTGLILISDEDATWEDSAQISVSTDTGDAVILSIVETAAAGSTNRLSIRRYLGADHTRDFFDTTSSAYASIDSYNVVQYTSTVDDLKEYVGVTGSYDGTYSAVETDLYNFLSALFGDSIALNMKNDFDTAINNAFTEAIARSTANGLPSALAMKYKSGVTKREVDALINSSTYAAQYAVASPLITIELSAITNYFDDARNNLV